MESAFDMAAAHRGGYILSRDLRDLGLRHRDIVAAMKAGLIERLRHGIYAKCDLVSGLTPEQRHLLIAQATYDRLGPGYVMSHVTASVKHTGVSMTRELDTIHFTKLSRSSSRSEAGVSWHVNVLPDSDIEQVDGRLYTRPVRAAIESASVLSLEAAMIQTSFALRLHQPHLEELSEMAKRLERVPNIKAARLAILYAAPASESVGEARSIYMFRRGGVRIPRQQVEIRDARGQVVARVDFGWEEECHTGEFDGLVKYGRLNPYAQDVGRVLVDEKHREDAVRATGKGMTRWVWHDLDRPRVTCARIQADLERSRSLYTRGRVILS